MSGLLRMRLPVLLRRAITIVPAFGQSGRRGGPDVGLVLSQVLLSIGIPFVLIPLVLHTSSAEIMGAFVNTPAVTGGCEGRDHGRSWH